MNIKKIAAFAIGPIGSAALGFITLPIITWFYSTEDIGRIAMLQVVSSFCILLFGLGLDQAYVREYHESEKKPALLKATLFPGFLIFLVILILSFIVPSFISRMLFAVDNILINVLVAVCFLAAFLSRFLSLILRMEERGLAFSMSQVLPKLIFLSVIGFYVLFSFGFDLLHLIIAHMVSIVSVTLIYSWNTRHEWLASLRFKIELQNLKAMLKYSIPLIFGGLASWGLAAMDRLFLRSLSTFGELGIYSVAASFASAAIIFQSIFSTVWAPTVYKWVAEGINTDKVDKVRESVLAVVVILFALSGLFSWVIPFLLPEKYNRVEYLIVICMAYPLFYTLSETTVIGIGVTRKTGYAMLASVVAALTNFIGNYLLVPELGASGAAISTAISFWIFLVLRTEFSCLVWRSFPRFKLYIFVLICLVFAILFNRYGEFYKIPFVVIWFIVLLGGLYLVPFNKKSDYNL